MATAVDCAKYLNRLSSEETGRFLPEGCLQGMLYLCQRESLLLRDRPLFADAFKAGPHGPAVPAVHAACRSGQLACGGLCSGTPALSPEDAVLVEAVWRRYNGVSRWDMVTIVCSEYSWTQARKGCTAEGCGREITMSAIRVDAKREALRRKGVILPPVK